MNLRAIVGAALLSARAGFVCADDWPQWRGLNRDAVWNEPGVLQKFPPGGLTISSGRRKR